MSDQQVITQKISDDVKSLLTSTVSQLNEVWETIGYPQEEKYRQLDDLINGVRNLCQDKVKEEESVATEFKRGIVDARKELIAKSKALHIDADAKLMEQGGQTLTDDLSTLESALEGLRSAASAATADLNDCRDKLLSMNQALGTELTPTWHDIESDLTSKRREQFHRQVSEMQEVVATRRAAVTQLLVDCQNLIRDLAIDLESNKLDRQIMGSLSSEEGSSVGLLSDLATETCTGISSAALKDLTNRVSELNGEKRRRKQRLGQLGAEIAMLWEKLRVPPEVQSAFTSSVQGLGMDTIMKGEAEVKRLNGMKSKMLVDLIAEARETIVALWEETNTNDEQRRSFTAMELNGDHYFTDELLAIHDEYIQVLQKRLDQMRPLLKIIEKREFIVKERQEYEEIQKDPDRLKQRGSALTKQLMLEEKMSRRIKKDLPKYTEMLIKKCEEWKVETCDAFRYKGEDYLKVMSAQEEDWQLYKAKEAHIKLERKQAETGQHDERPDVFKRLPGRKRAKSKNRALADMSNGVNRPGSYSSSSQGSHK
uniref:Protein regulator of cytokinesis 1 n=1 Tax=Corethron hystrix TaxID=216773 RepID=A0A7S1FM88_9STRA|mmetsp:Transcript_125/g.270  ORF Transcript_125/g.270 Transcript_125/m.270 type:complete len:540 (+) Transcript_125:244-1863(+)|eukprot:CAMPEP_0113315744 /NCGR_PEP_ID=MMETSP0010_2-20120614/11292_1 /TAXON_ID=216773 ORGANISM="Corethron hystrix, Strain 308" /NCGR_SAMPLE_ID=MMETSP0010_2 /ASSEMBLY_ACC=CAM_ASM_000155 /LENGTH=539 /DNA_ID=CAMNT_0000172311 /DNA_START=85 /DNA_END=1704 /DNA_ORIENTATION=- /assembly_acc=CAM_ASM_000155